MRHLLAFGILLVSTAFASGEAAIRVIDTEVIQQDDRAVVLRGDFEVPHSPHRWLAVYFQIRLDDGPLRMPDGKELLREWGRVFTPESTDEPTRWSECRLGLALSEIERATNLPRGRRVTLWAQCDIWDRERSAFVASGRAVAAPLLVTVDAEGRITKCERFTTRPLEMPKIRPFTKKAVRTCALDLKHLKLLPGVRVHRAVCIKHVIHDWLYRSVRAVNEHGILVTTVNEVEIDGPLRGAFFEPIGTADQALELVALAHPRCVVVPSRKAYEAILAFLRAKDWSAAIKTPTPPGYGLTVTPVANLGWRIRGLLLEVDGLARRPDGVLRHVDYAVSRTNRIGLASVVCIETDPRVILGLPGVERWTRLPRYLRVAGASAEVKQFEGNVGEFMNADGWPEGFAKR